MYKAIIHAMLPGKKSGQPFPRGSCLGEEGVPWAVVCDGTDKLALTLLSQLYLSFLQQEAVELLQAVLDLGENAALSTWAPNSPSGAS